MSRDEQNTIINQVRCRINAKYKTYNYNGAPFGSKSSDNILIDYINRLPDCYKIEISELLKFYDYNETNKKFESAKRPKDDTKQRKSKKVKAEDDYHKIVDYLIYKSINPFDNKVIIVDEVQLLISFISNAKERGFIFYKLITNACNSRIVLLSGTPVVNNIFEFAILFNMLNGYTKEINVKLIPTNKIQNVHDVLSHDRSIEKFRLKRIENNEYRLYIVRNPVEYMEYINKLKYSYNENFTCSEEIYLNNLMRKYQDVCTIDTSDYKINRYSLFDNIGEKTKNPYYNLEYSEENIKKVKDKFVNDYYDDKKMTIRNSRDFMKRIQGYVSYFASITGEQKKLVGYPEKDEYVIFSEMSNTQFTWYEFYRNDEIRQDGKKKDGDFSSNSNSRQSALCVYSESANNLRKTETTRTKYLSDDFKQKRKDMNKDEIKHMEIDINRTIINSCNLQDINMYSPKYKILLKMMMLSKGPILTYCDLIHYEGLETIVKYLDLMGYREYQLEGKLDLTKELREKLNEYCLKDIDTNNKIIQDHIKIVKKFIFDSELNVTNGDVLNSSDLSRTVVFKLEDTDETYNLWRIGKISKLYDDLTVDLIYFDSTITKDDYYGITISKMDSNERSQILEEDIDVFEKKNRDFDFSISVKQKVSIDKLYSANYIRYTGDESDKTKQQIVNKFVKDDNKHGCSLLNILGSQSIAEGLNLKYIRQVNIMTHFWNKVKIEQVIGRSTRMGSHISLKREEQHVNVYHYITDFTDIHDISNTIKNYDSSKTIEEKMYTTGFKKYYKINEFFKLLKENAIDCSFHMHNPIKIMDQDSSIKCNTNLYDEILGKRYNKYSYMEMSKIIDDNDTYLGMPTKTMSNLTLEEYKLDNNNGIIRIVINKNEDADDTILDFYKIFLNFNYITDDVLGYSTDIEDFDNNYLQFWQLIDDIIKTNNIDVYKMIRIVELLIYSRENITTKLKEEYDKINKTISESIINRLDLSVNLNKLLYKYIETIKESEEYYNTLFKLRDKDLWKLWEIVIDEIIDFRKDNLLEDFKQFFDMVDSSENLLSSEKNISKINGYIIKKIENKLIKNGVDKSELDTIKLTEILNKLKEDDPEKYLISIKNLISVI